MGSGITTPKLSAHVHAKNDSDSQTNITVISDIYRDESKDLHRVLNSVRSTSAFLKYLDRSGNGKDWFLKIYLLVDSKATVNDLQRPHSPGVLSSTILWEQELYDLISEIKSNESITSKDMILVDSLKIEEICHLYLKLLLPEFLESHEFGNFKSSLRNISDITHAAINVKSIGKNILIIDDSPQHSRFMSIELKAHGHHVCQANHGWIGVHVASLNHFDVILIDLAMNTMDPYEVVKQIKIKRKLSSERFLEKSPFFVGLNYSEYDSALKSHDVMCSIHVDFLLNSTSTSKFMVDFNASLILYEEILKDCGNNFYYS